MDLTGVVISTTTIFAIATIVYIALAALWPVRKGIKLLNRS